MIEELEHRFQPILSRFVASAPVQRIVDGEISRAEYRTIMREVFHHTRENPQLQVLATVYFKGRQRDMVSSFFRHAASEIGHDQLALNDYQTLGGRNAELIPYQNPLPATTALLAYGFYQIYNLNPLGYLGYLFFLEFTPTRSGAGMMDLLSAAGIGREAMTFLQDHTTIDQGHNRMMEKYASHLIKSNADLDAVTYAMETTGELYSGMLGASIADADSTDNHGWNWEELQADGKTIEELSLGVA